MRNRLAVSKRSLSLPQHTHSQCDSEGHSRLVEGSVCISQSTRKWRVASCQSSLKCITMKGLERGLFGAPGWIQLRSGSGSGLLINVDYRVLTDTIVLTERNIKTLPKLYLSRLGNF